jgi:hypothetical protein
MNIMVGALLGTPKKGIGMQCAKCYDTVAVMLTDQEKRIRAEYIGGPMSKPEMTDVIEESVFLANLHYFYAQTDGSYAIPNSKDGDMLKRAKVEIEQLRDQLSQRERTGEAVPEVVVDTGDGIFWSTHTIHAQVINGQWRLQVKVGLNEAPPPPPPPTNEYVAEGCQLFTPPSPPSSRELLEREEPKASCLFHRGTNRLGCLKEALWNVKQALL